mgnify:CR=1 FL=1
MLFVFVVVLLSCHLFVLLNIFNLNSLSFFLWFGLWGARGAGGTTHPPPHHDALPIFISAQRLNHIVAVGPDDRIVVVGSDAVNELSITHQTVYDSAIRAEYLSRCRGSGGAEKEQPKQRAQNGQKEISGHDNS